MENGTQKVWSVVHAAATVALWLYVEGADVGLVGLIRATRVLEAALEAVKKAINETQ